MEEKTEEKNRSIAFSTPSWETTKKQNTTRTFCVVHVLGVFCSCSPALLLSFLRFIVIAMKWHCRMDTRVIYLTWLISSSYCGWRSFCSLSPAGPLAIFHLAHRLIQLMCVCVCDQFEKRKINYDALWILCCAQQCSTKHGSHWSWAHSHHNIMSTMGRMYMCIVPLCVCVRTINGKNTSAHHPSFELNISALSSLLLLLLLRVHIGSYQSLHTLDMLLGGAAHKCSLIGMVCTSDQPTTANGSIYSYAVVTSIDGNILLHTTTPATSHGWMTPRTDRT